jgi:hypothetical protein
MRSSNKVIHAALLGNVLVALTKFVAAGLTGSSAVTLLIFGLGAGVSVYEGVSHIIAPVPIRTRS